MRDDGIQRGIEDLGAKAAPISLGTVIAAEESAGGVSVLVELEPSGFEVEARLVSAATSSTSRAVFPSPVTKGLEVLVLFPGGNRNAAIAIAGLTSSAVLATTGGNAEVIDPEGLDVRRTAGAPVEGVARGETLIGDLDDLLAAFETWIQAWVLLTPGTPVQNAAAIAALQAGAASTLIPQLAALRARFALSALNGLPHISPALRAE